ncbi:hypothetical protein HZF05_03105 [Sphingomonas sp. CGMCC 1.13654]|uniref:Uncharacterized protein n=1 Tax=Sphingomonas chungangi TaxID=2683589 RepID=A0A838L3U8_9SPHN|nr:hypothetical protein [Sphingomonas chungangi]MBA2933079.1 hypothetical protein [Sphingomonas chungangi]MVW56699.1 hypothetical protein [Sphingomonas chungangi]
MMNETEEMKQARRELQLLSASDPAALRNMLRYAAALKMMVTGRLERGRRGGEPHIAAGFQLTAGEQQMMMALTLRTGEEQLYLTFDIDDAAGVPTGLGFIRKEGEAVACYNCGLWAPTNDGRALIVPHDESFEGYLAFQPEGPLLHVRSPLPGDRQAGFRRASIRLPRIANSKAVQDIRANGHMHVFRSEDAGLISARTSTFGA